MALAVKKAARKTVAKKSTKRSAAKWARVAKKAAPRKPELSKKNQVVIEIVTSTPITEKQAMQAVGLLTDRIDLGAHPIWANASDIYADSLKAKQFSRVVSKLKR